MKSKLNEWDENTIKREVHAHNEFEALKRITTRTLKLVLEDMQGKEVLKVDGYLKKKYETMIKEKLEEVKQNIIFRPLKKGYWFNLHYFYASASEYSLYIKCSFNFQTGEAKENGSTPNQYKEFYIDIGNFERVEEYKNNWGHPLNKKVFEKREVTLRDDININSVLEQAEKVQYLKEKFQEEKTKLEPYTVKEVFK